MDDHAFADRASTPASTGDPTGDDRSDPRPPAARRPLPTTIDAVVRDWAEACELPAFGSCTITFEDPAAIVRAVLGVGLAPSEPTAIANLERAVLRFHIHPSVAVVQLVALSRVVHRSTFRGGHGAIRLEVDRPINLAIAAVLDELEQRGLVDALTGLLNRRALDRDLVELVRAASRRDGCLLVVMADLEGLKDTNDSLGHAAGDDRLRRAAATLSSALRTGDNVYRIGGDEFVILMPDLELRDLDAVLGRVDHATATPLTWGCAWERIMPDLDAEREAARLLELADQRLLRYRWSGRGDPIARDALGAIVAGRFGPARDPSSRRR